MSPKAHAFRRFIEYPRALHSQCDPLECHEHQRGRSLCIHSNYDSQCLDWKQIIPGHLYANTRHERLCNVPNIVLDSNVSHMWPVLWENLTERLAPSRDLGQCWLNSMSPYSPQLATIRQQNIAEPKMYNTYFNYFPGIPIWGGAHLHYQNEPKFPYEALSLSALLIINIVMVFRV